MQTEKLFKAWFTADGRVMTVSREDDKHVLEWLRDKRYGGLGNTVYEVPYIVHSLPEEMKIVPLDSGAMTVVWSSWRVGDWVYGRGSGDGALSENDGVVSRFTGLELAAGRPVDVDMAVHRLAYSQGPTEQVGVDSLIGTVIREWPRKKPWYLPVVIWHWLLGSWVKEAVGRLLKTGHLELVIGSLGRGAVVRAVPGVRRGPGLDGPVYMGESYGEL